MRRVAFDEAYSSRRTRRWEVLVLHYVAGLSVEEVAGQLRLPVGTVKSRLNRARHRLAELFGDEREGVSNA